VNSQVKNEVGFHFSKAPIFTDDQSRNVSCPVPVARRNEAAQTRPDVACEWRLEVAAWAGARAALKIHIQAELPFHQEFVFIIARSPELDHFFVLRLMTVSILVTCCTGRSAAFSPFNMRPV
jgi:hypothetical protein